MKRFLVFAFMIAAMPALADTSILVNKASQRMTVDSPQGHYEFKVSTAMPGMATPTGVFHPQSLQIMHRSKKYHNSPMPHSIFFHGGYAIHGTYDMAHLGRPASHGCVRLSPENAAILFGIVKQESRTEIRIIGGK